eukprot:Sdes_comp17417_c0_seq1m6632
MDFWVAVLKLLLLFSLCFSCEDVALFSNKVFPPNQCEMTWMRNSPSYHSIPFDSASSRHLSNICSDSPHCFQHASQTYSLHLYSETHAAPLSSLPKLNPVPVLFIPGSQGSKNQIRSIASVVEQLHFYDHERGNSPRRTFQFEPDFLEPHQNDTFSPLPEIFQFFTVDFSEEDSGINGGFLSLQSNYVAACLYQIRRLYQRQSFSSSSSSDLSLMVIAHSMGGVVARAAFARDDTILSVWGSITLLTLATPHLRPLVAVDASMLKMYQEMDLMWEKRVFPSSKVLLVSIAGGYRDVIIPAHLATRLPPNLHPFANSHHFIANVASSIPHVWLATDHKCIMWCRQLVYVLARMMYDWVDASTLQMASSLRWRHQIASFYLVSRHVPPSPQNIRPKPFPLPPSSSLSTLCHISQSFSQIFHSPLNIPLFALHPLSCLPPSSSSSSHLFFLLTNLRPFLVQCEGKECAEVAGSPQKIPVLFKSAPQKSPHEYTFLAPFLWYFPVNLSAFSEPSHLSHWIAFQHPLISFSHPKHQISTPPFAAFDKLQFFSANSFSVLRDLFFSNSIFNIQNSSSALIRFPFSHRFIAWNVDVVQHQKSASWYPSVNFHSNLDSFHHFSSSPRKFRTFAGFIVNLFPLFSCFEPKTQLEPPQISAT